MAKLEEPPLPDAAPKKSSKVITEIPVTGADADALRQFNAACDLKKHAESVIEKVRPRLAEIGLAYVFDFNRNHATTDVIEQIASVNLVAPALAGDGKADPTGRLEKTQFTWSRKNLKNAVDKVKAVFDRVLTVAGKKPNINNYVVYETVATFDGAIFKDNGKFSQKRYDAVMEAMNDVAFKLGVENPLSCAKVLVPKEDFHERRWQVFSAEVNLELHKVLPTQVSLEPVRPKKDVQEKS